MPETDGFTLTRRIKADPQFGRAKIVLLTSGDQSRDSGRCGDLGVSACLAKPVGEMELLEAITQTLLPAAKKRSQPHPSPRHRTQAALPRLRLLVVEDNPVNGLVARRLLEKQNYAVRTANNGREALEIMQKEEFDCVLMDLQMPVLDGFETTAAIRQNERISGGHLQLLP